LIDVSFQGLAPLATFLRRFAAGVERHVNQHRRNG